MKDFKRTNLIFSLCGLNCGLCTMNLDHYCPGCGGGAGNQPCAIARCSRQQGGLEYCYLCDEYPCSEYDGIDEYDSFITHRNQRKDLEKVKGMGVDSYQVELLEKMELLKYLLANFNDGRHKSFYCMSVNLLDLCDVKSIVRQAASETEAAELSIKEKAALAANLFHSVAAERNIVLKLNKKPGKK